MPNQSTLHLLVRAAYFAEWAVRFVSTSHVGKTREERASFKARLFTSFHKITSARAQFISYMYNFGFPSQTVWHRSSGDLLLRLLHPEAHFTQLEGLDHSGPTFSGNPPMASHVACCLSRRGHHRPLQSPLTGLKRTIFPR